MRYYPALIDDVDLIYLLQKTRIHFCPGSFPLVNPICRKKIFEAERFLILQNRFRYVTLLRIYSYLHPVGTI